MAHVRVLIRNRPGVFDPAGKVVQSGLKRLGHDVGNVTIGKVIDLEIPGDVASVTQTVNQMCQQFLVNPVLEDFTIEFLDGVS
ncbi:MAG: phosphoribosylformylglycinamidine synthase subunit PurS [bacterium]